MSDEREVKKARAPQKKQAFVFYRGEGIEVVEKFTDKRKAYDFFVEHPDLKQIAIDL